MKQNYGIEDWHSRVVIHFLRTINETTGGYREFAVWRTEHVKYEKNIVFVCGNRTEGNKRDFPGIEIVWGNRDIKRTREKIKEIYSICSKKDIPIVFHIQQLGAITDIISACVGLNIRKHMLYTEKNTFARYTNATKRDSILCALYAKHLTFLSYASYEDYPKLVKLLKRGNISIIEHGACQDEITRIDWAKRKDRIRPTLELVYTARLVSVKNHMFLLDIMEKLEDMHLTFIGGGEQLPTIQNEIRKKHLENKITITGLVRREEVYKILEQGDVYVSPSTFEGLPVSVLEAMHAGLPIVLSNIKPHIEIAQKTNGIKILPLEKKLWIDQLNCFKQMKIEELAKMGERNAEVAKHCFTLDRMNKRYSRLYSSLE